MIHPLVRTLGLLWAASFAALFGVIFLSAYLGDGSVLVRIDALGEADLELVVLALVVYPVMTAALWDALTD